jgi:glycosyltransferase involved in cell wall biosynthesis
VIEKHGLSEKVRLLGPKKPAELQNLYQEACFFALSSDEEGLGIVLLEAMASGLPVVSTACGGPESIVEHGRSGFLVPIADADALSKAMGRLVEQPALCHQMGLDARRAAVERFSIAATSRIFLEQYEKALSTAHSECVK